MKTKSERAPGVSRAESPHYQLLALPNRPQDTTLGSIRATKIQSHCDHCDGLTLRLVRYVEPSGGASDCCLACYCCVAGLPAPIKHRPRSTRNRSAVVRARLQFGRIFDRRRPLGEISGAAGRQRCQWPPAALAASKSESIGSDSEGPLCECGRPLADNRRPHADRCDECIDNRPASPIPSPPPDPDPCSGSFGQLIPFVRPIHIERRLRRAA